MTQLPPERFHGEGADAPDGVFVTLEQARQSKTESLPLANVLIALLLGSLAVWAYFKITLGSHDFDPMVYDPAQPTIGGSVVPEPPSLVKIGEKVYTKHCVTCHQASGEGLPGSFPTLHGTSWVLGNEQRLVNILLSGLSGKLEINGQVFDGNMPSWGNVLKDKEIAGVLTYIRSKSEWGNQTGEVSVETVAAMRAQFGVRSEPWSAQSLQEAFPEEPPSQP